MFVLLSAWALAAPCHRSLSPEEWARELAAIQDPVVMGEEEVEANLDLLVQDAACVSAPVERTDLARLWMARGATFILRRASPADAERALGTAKALAGEAAWDPDYGPVVRRAFQAAPIAPEGTLHVRLPHDVLVVDGLVHYESVPIPVPAGSHLVQWSVDGVWNGAWIEVSEGSETAFGVQAAPAPAPSAGLPALPTLGRYDLLVEGGMGHLALASWIYVPPSSLDKTQLYPSGPPRVGEVAWGMHARQPSGGSVGHVRVALGWNRALLSLSGTFAPDPSEASRWPAPAGLTALVGGRAEGPWWSVSGGVGLRVSATPVALPVEQWGVHTPDGALPAYAPRPNAGPALGGQLRLGGTVGFALNAELWAGPGATGGELWLGPTARYGALEPSLKVRAGGMGVARSLPELPDSYSDQHVWLGAEATLGVRF